METIKFVFVFKTSENFKKAVQYFSIPGTDVSTSGYENALNFYNERDFDTNIHELGRIGIRYLHDYTVKWK